MSNDTGYHSGTIKDNRETDEKIKENENFEGTVENETTASN